MGRRDWRNRPIREQTDARVSGQTERARWVPKGCPSTAPWGQGLVSSRDVPCQNLPMEADGFWNIPRIGRSWRVLGCRLCDPGESGTTPSARDRRLLSDLQQLHGCALQLGPLGRCLHPQRGMFQTMGSSTSEPGFSHEGRSVTELALSDSEGFGLSVSPDTEPDEMECEDLIYAGRSAYKTLTGNFGPPRAAPQPGGTLGEEWEESTAGLRSRFPRLAAHWGMA